MKSPGDEHWDWTAEHVLHALDVMARGGLALFRCNVGYALAGTTVAAVDRIYELKGRPRTKPCVTLGNRATMEEISSVWTEHAPLIRQLERASSVGFITPLRRDADIFDSVDPELLRMCTKSGTIAIFLRMGLFIDALTAEAWRRGMLVVASSANTSGTGNCVRYNDVPDSITANVDVSLDGGEIYWTGPRLGSTVVDLNDLTVMRSAANSNEIESRLAAYRIAQLQRGGS